MVFNRPLIHVQVDYPDSCGNVRTVSQFKLLCCVIVGYHWTIENNSLWTPKFNSLCCMIVSLNSKEQFLADF